MGVFMTLLLSLSLILWICPNTCSIDINANTVDIGIESLLPKAVVPDSPILGQIVPPR